MLAQERTQRRAPGFRPGTLLQGPRAGGAELASLRHPSPSSARAPFRKGLHTGGEGQNRRYPYATTPQRLCRPKAPGARLRARHATAKGQACPRWPKTSPSSTGNNAGTAVVLTSLPVVVAPSGEAFRGRKGAGCLSGAAGAASSAPPAKSLGARETPARTAGRGRGSRACFLGTSLHEQRSTSRCAGESAPGSMWTEGT